MKQKYVFRKQLPFPCEHQDRPLSHTAGKSRASYIILSHSPSGEKGDYSSVQTVLLQINNFTNGERSPKAVVVKTDKMGVVPHTCNLSTLEVEAGGSQ